MNPKDALKARAKETNRQVVTTKLTDNPDKVDNKTDAINALKKHKEASEESRKKQSEALRQSLRHRSTQVTTLDITTPVDGLIKKFSMSALDKYTTCPQQLKFGRIDKVKTPQSKAAKRGNDIHDICEEYVRGERDKLQGDKQTRMDHFHIHFNKLRKLFEQRKVQTERDWFVRRDWSPCTKKDPNWWGQFKLDAFVRESDTSCRIIDYKTGRPYPVKHGQQGLGYASAAFYKYPEIESFTVEFWYLDQAEMTVRNFNRSMIEKLHVNINQRAVQMTTDKELKPTPNANSCRFCPYGSNTNKMGEPYGIGYCESDYYKGYEVL